MHPDLETAHSGHSRKHRISVQRLKDGPTHADIRADINGIAATSGDPPPEDEF
jgi:hypothetical protein